MDFASQNLNDECCLELADFLLHSHLESLVLNWLWHYK